MHLLDMCGLNNINGVDQKNAGCTTYVGHLALCMPWQQLAGGVLEFDKVMSSSKMLPRNSADADCRDSSRHVEYAMGIYG